jgi:cytochrome c1
MLMLVCPYQSALAAMIGTESIINVDRGQSPRDYLNNLLAREDTQAALVSQGIDPQEAQTRIDSLSDAEVNDIVNKLDQLPAGGVLGTILIIAFLVFAIFVFTDIAGYTDIFPFIKKK